MKKEMIRYAFVLLVLFLVFWFIYPTPYYYSDYSNSSGNYVQKVNRFTGEGWYWTSYRGWREVPYNDQ